MKITYTNSKGASIVFAQSAPFYITSIEGFSDVENLINLSKAVNQDGATPTNATLDVRYLVIQGEYDYKDRQEGRNKLIQVINPKLDGVLRYERGDVRRIIYCKPESSPIIPSTRLSTVPYIVNLMASNPYWLSEDTESTEIVSWIGGLRFPVTLPAGFATSGEKVINVINSGDVETPIRLEISGKATNPKITNTQTGEYMKVKRVLDVNDTLIITTDFGNKRVEQNGVSVFNNIDLTSTFFSLKTGDNVIEFETESLDDNAKVTISYRNRYIGV